MYFIPEKNRWYSRVVHTPPLVRYFGLLIFLGIILCIWRYGLYAWFDASIKQEQASIFQLEQQYVQQSAIERKNNELSRQIPLLKNTFNNLATQSIGNASHEHYTYLFSCAANAGLRIMGYYTAKEKKKKPWKQSRYVDIKLIGSRDQLQNFLVALKNSSRMIQCIALSLQRTDENKFAITCTIQFIIPQS